MARVIRGGSSKNTLRFGFWKFLYCSILAAVFILSNCQQQLELRELVMQKVEIATGEFRGIKSVINGVAYSAAIGINGNNLYILYYDSVLQKLMIIKSPDRGNTWNSPFVVDNTIGYYGTSNNIAIDGSEIYIAYQRTDSVYFIKLTDQGFTFIPSNAQKISVITTYPYGYECSIAFDTQNVYIVYSAGGGPAFTKALKGSTMTFSTPVFIDSILSESSGNRKPTALFVDSIGNINVSYFDDTTGSEGLKVANFAPTDVLPKEVNRIPTTFPGSTYMIAQQGASIAMAAQPLFMSYYDSSAKTLNVYESFSYTNPPSMILYYVRKSVTVDSSSSDIGRYCQSVYWASKLYTAYYDSANKLIKFSTGTKVASIPPEYSFTPVTIGSVGGSNMGISLAFDASRGIFYIVYYDSAGGGSLKLAKSLDYGVTW